MNIILTWWSPFERGNALHGYFFYFVIQLLTTDLLYRNYIAHFSQILSFKQEETSGGILFKNMLCYVCLIRFWSVRLCEHCLQLPLLTLLNLLICSLNCEVYSNCLACVVYRKYYNSFEHFSYLQTKTNSVKKTQSSYTFSKIFLFILFISAQDIYHLNDNIALNICRLYSCISRDVKSNF